MPLLTSKLLVFDLDGTLIDSRVDLCHSLNATLAHLGESSISDSVIASFVGDGVSNLVRRALAYSARDHIDESRIERAVQFFLDYYRCHKLDFTYVYPGVTEALDLIRQKHPNVLMAVLTNKPVRPSREICAHFGLDRFFFQNFGGDSFETKKPHPRGLLALIAEASAQLRRIDFRAVVSTSEVIMIGDSDIDILTARNCKCRSIGCTFGLALEKLLAVEPEVLAHSPSDWPALIEL